MTVLVNRNLRGWRLGRELVDLCVARMSNDTELVPEKSLQFIRCGALEAAALL